MADTFNDPQGRTAQARGMGAPPFFTEPREQRSQREWMQLRDKMIRNV